jgi:hypothetical protein
MSSVVVPHEIFFNFAIDFLNHCEANKNWVKNRGYAGATCGYTGPGIGLVIKFFQHNQIYNEETLQHFLITNGFTIEQLMDIINETIANFLDVIDECPVTGVPQGIRGLLEKEAERSRPNSTVMQTDDPQVVYTVEEGGSNLVEGVNVISFTSRAHGCDTFHHATLYTIPETNVCFIIDSWATPEGVPFECRPLTCRQFSFREVIHQLDRLNSDAISPEEMTHIFGYYFMAHAAFLQNIPNLGLVTVNTVSPDYIVDVYTTCEKRIREGQSKSDFGGKLRKKRNKKTRKLNKKNKSKKYKSKNKSKK